jgi:hypothetical protein
VGVHSVVGPGIAPSPITAPNTTTRQEFKVPASDEYWARDPGAKPRSLFAAIGLRVPAILYNSGLNLYEHHFKTTPLRLSREGTILSVDGRIRSASRTKFPRILVPRRWENRAPAIRREHQLAADRRDGASDAARTVVGDSGLTSPIRFDCVGIETPVQVDYLAVFCLEKSPPQVAPQPPPALALPTPLPLR